MDWPTDVLARSAERHPCDNRFGQGDTDHDVDRIGSRGGMVVEPAPGDNMNASGSLHGASSSRSGTIALCHYRITLNRRLLQDYGTRM